MSFVYVFLWFASVCYVFMYLLNLLDPIQSYEHGRFDMHFFSADASTQVDRTGGCRHNIVGVGAAWVLLQYLTMMIDGKRCLKVESRWQCFGLSEIFEVWSNHRFKGGLQKGIGAPQISSTWRPWLYCSGMWWSQLVSSLEGHLLKRSPIPKRSSRATNWNLEVNETLLCIERGGGFGKLNC